MRKILLMLLFLGACGVANAQCTYTVTAIDYDSVKNHIRITTEYRLNGVVVQVGETRYTDEKPDSEGLDNGKWTLTELKQKIKSDLDKHCENIIARIDENTLFIAQAKETIENDARQPIVTNLQTYIGTTGQVTSASRTYKGKTITVTYDSQNTVTNFSP